VSKRDAALVGREKRKASGCEVCGWSVARRALHVHHVVPLACGGEDGPENLVVLCPNHHALAHVLGKRSRSGEWRGARKRRELVGQLRRVDKRGAPSWLDTSTLDLVRNLRGAKVEDANSLMFSGLAAG
jgi:hypothetical protein